MHLGVVGTISLFFHLSSAIKRLSNFKPPITFTQLFLMSDIRDSPSAERNKDPIWNELQPMLKANDRVLMVAEGSGVHMEHFAVNADPSITWYPTDPSTESLASQAARIERSNLQGKVQKQCHFVLDEAGCDSEEVPSTVDVIVNINMIHISPWSATIGLMKEAGKRLSKEGTLYLYGPYRVNGTCVESNSKFEMWLREKDQAYGLRDLEKVVDLAAEHGLDHHKTVEMPANNLSVIFRKR